MMADLAASVADIRNTVAELAQEQKRHPVSRPRAMFYSGRPSIDFENIYKDAHDKYVFIQSKRAEDMLSGAIELCPCASGKPYNECHGGGGPIGSTIA
jgi:hypothetical protein